MFKVIIAGSRSFDDYKLLNLTLEEHNQVLDTSLYLLSVHLK